MPGQPSYYFTLFKKFQTLSGVPAQWAGGHSGNAQGGFDLNNPNAPFTGGNRGPSIVVPDTNKTHSPLWVILNACANGTLYGILVNIVGGTQGGTSWPAMPPNSPGWQEFQINPVVKLVDVFGNWIQSSGQINDTPGWVIGQQPAQFNGPDAGFVPFVCSMPGDQGVRPGVPPNWWATSLIFLTDENGNIANPSSLGASNHYFLTAVIGNRGNTSGGRYLGHPNSIDAAAAVMVFSTAVSPGVMLPALSNFDVNDQNANYEQYFLRSGAYDVVGFRMDVQTVFDGIILAVQDAVTNNGLNLGGLTPEQWVKAPPAHLCAKVVIREHGTNYPNFGDTPDQDRRLAQKNLVPFDISLTTSSQNPNIIWKNFIIGQPIFLKIAGAGGNWFNLRAELPANAFRLYLAVPKLTFERYFARHAEDALKGFRVVSPKEIAGGNLGERAVPFPEAVVLQMTANNDNVVQLPALEEKEFVAMALGVEYDRKLIKAGNVGDINFVHHTIFPKLKPGTRCFDLEERVAGGFTLRVRAEDPHIGPKGKRIEFPDGFESDRG